MKFSIIIPTFHRNDLLTQCLDCLASDVQTLAADQYEVIVTDDGRTTTAENLIQEQYPWVTWVAGPQQGPAANRNNGAKVAQGEWLVFTDDDCLPDIQWLEAYSAAIIHDIYVYEGKTTCKDGIISPLYWAPVNLSGGFLWSCNMMIQKKLLSKLNGFDERFPHPHLEDVDLRERLQQLSLIFQFVPNAIVDHPPRKLPWGNRLGVMHESFFYYWYSRGEKPSKRQLLYELCINRWKRLFSYPFSFEQTQSLISFLYELFYVLLNLHSWDKKYKRYIER